MFRTARLDKERAGDGLGPDVPPPTRAGSYRLLIRPTDSPSDNIQIEGSLGDCMNEVEGWLADKRGRGIAFLHLVTARESFGYTPLEVLELVAQFTHPSKWNK